MLVDSFTEAELKERSKNPGWTNGELLFHMTLGFWLISALAPWIRFFGRLPEGYSRFFASLLNASTGPFNWINALIGRIGGKINTRERILSRFNRVYDKSLLTLDSLLDEERVLRMHNPTRWDDLFTETWTMEDLFHYATVHFEFHRDQLSIGQ
jgi:hypothetical protein